MGILTEGARQRVRSKAYEKGWITNKIVNRQPKKWMWFGPLSALPSSSILLPPTMAFKYQLPRYIAFLRERFGSVLFFAEGMVQVLFCWSSRRIVPPVHFVGRFSRNVALTMLVAINQTGHHSINYWASKAKAHTVTTITHRRKQFALQVNQTGNSTIFSSFE